MSFNVENTKQVGNSYKFKEWNCLYKYSFFANLTYGFILDKAFDLQAAFIHNISMCFSNLILLSIYNSTGSADSSESITSLSNLCFYVFFYLLFVFNPLVPGVH